MLISERISVEKRNLKRGSCVCNSLNDPHIGSLETSHELFRKCFQRLENFRKKRQFRNKWMFLSSEKSHRRFPLQILF